MFSSTDGRKHSDAGGEISPDGRLASGFYIIN
jgi:hypothetical protein